MIIIKIEIPQWKDITKWFWDKFCFPRRKVVAEYFERYNEECTAELIDYLYSAWDCYNDENSFAKLKDINLHLSELMEKKTEKIKSIMYKLKLYENFRSN